MNNALLILWFFKKISAFLVLISRELLNVDILLLAILVLIASLIAISAIFFGIWKSKDLGFGPWQVLPPTNCTDLLLPCLALPVPFCFQGFAVVPDISANGEGAIYATATGGTPPYNYTWLNGSTNDSLENLSAGSYLVQVIDANGCRTSRAFVVNGATWIEDDEIVNISVYPNPAQEYINVSLALPFTAAVHVQVVNTLGQEMYSANYTAIKTATIPIETKLFATGNYFVKVESEFFSKRIRFIVAK
jgi:hypothetical protein